MSRQSEAEREKAGPGNPWIRRRRDRGKFCLGGLPRKKQSTANAPIIRFILRTSTTSVDRSRKPAAPRPASRQYVPASSCAKPLPGIQRPRGSYAERPLRQTAGVVRFRSSLEGLTDKGRELFRKYSEQFYPSDVLRSLGLEPVCGCGRTYRLLDYGQVVPGCSERDHSFGGLHGSDAHRNCNSFITGARTTIFPVINFFWDKILGSYRSLDAGKTQANGTRKRTHVNPTMMLRRGVRS
jgi:hypothetical protein